MAGFTTITTADVTLAATKTILSLIGASTIRPALNTIVIGPGNATPNDYSAVHQIQRFTADGTGTAVTPQDNEGATPRSSSKYNYTVEPTVTAGAILLSIGLNFRANYQWYANIGREKVVPAAAGNGLALRCAAVTTGFPVTETMEWTE